MKQIRFAALAFTFAFTLTLSPPPLMAGNSSEKELTAKTPELGLDAVVVTATRGEMEAFKAPSSVQLINSEQLNRSQAATLKDAINDIPNVDFDNGSDPSIQRPSIRGLSQDQLIIKIDGARQTYRGTGGIGRNPAPIDPGLLKKIEVLRGPASAMHGSGGIGGMISMTTKDAADFLAPGRNIGATLRTGYRSASEDLYGTLSVYGRKDKFDFLASGTYHDLGDYHSSSPTPGQENFSRDAYNGSSLFKVSMRPNLSHRLALSLNTFKDEYDNSDSLYRSDQQQLTGTWDWYRDDGLVDLKATAQYTKRNNTMLNELCDREDDFESLGFDIYNTFSGNIAGGLDARLTIGADSYFNQQEGTDFGKADPLRPDAESRDMGAFSRLDLILFDQLTITPAVRYTYYDRKSNSTDAEDQSDNRLSPRITVNWLSQKGLNLFASYAETYRAPTMDDIYFEIHRPASPNFPMDINVLPNPDLKPETAKTWEGGFGLKFNNVFAKNDPMGLKVVAFTERVYDFITASNEPVFTPTSMDYTTINVGEVHRYGFEVEASYRFSRFSFDASYGMVDGEDEETGDETGSVPQTLALRLGWDIPSCDLSFYWKSKFVDDSDHVLFQDRDHVPGYGVHGAGLVWSPPVNWCQGLRFDIGIDNLLDREYVNYRGGADNGMDVKLACTVSF
jgi:hemoglobin/transferrin/lactoferrin receptor protein